jgi:hypothetical protein
MTVDKLGCVQHYMSVEANVLRFGMNESATSHILTMSFTRDSRKLLNDKDLVLDPPTDFNPGGLREKSRKFIGIAHNTVDQRRTPRTRTSEFPRFCSTNVEQKRNKKTCRFEIQVDLFG